MVAEGADMDKNCDTCLCIRATDSLLSDFLEDFFLGGGKKTPPCPTKDISLSSAVILIHE